MIFLIAIACAPLVAMIVILRAKVRGTSQPHKLVQPGATPGPVTNLGQEPAATGLGVERSTTGLPASSPDLLAQSACTFRGAASGAQVGSGCETPRRPGSKGSGLFNFRDAVVSNIIWLALIVIVIALVVWNELRTTHE